MTLTTKQRIGCAIKKFSSFPPKDLESKKHDLTVQKYLGTHGYSELPARDLARCRRLARYGYSGGPLNAAELRVFDVSSLRLATSAKAAAAASNAPPTATAAPPAAAAAPPKTPKAATPKTKAASLPKAVVAPAAPSRPCPSAPLIPAALLSASLAEKRAMLFESPEKLPPYLPPEGREEPAAKSESDIAPLKASDSRARIEALGLQIAAALPLAKYLEYTLTIRNGKVTQTTLSAPEERTTILQPLPGT